MISYNFVGTIVVETRMKEKNLIIQLLRSNAFVEEKLNASLKPHGLSLPQFNVLRILRGRQGAPANLSNIQEQMIKPGMRGHRQQRVKLPMENHMQRMRSYKEMDQYRPKIHQMFNRMH